MTEIRTQQDLIKQHLAGLRQGLTAAEQAVADAQARVTEASVKRDEALLLLNEFEASRPEKATPPSWPESAHVDSALPPWSGPGPGLDAPKKEPKSAHPKWEKPEMPPQKATKPQPATPAKTTHAKVDEKAAADEQASAFKPDVKPRKLKR